MSELCSYYEIISPAQTIMMKKQKQVDNLQKVKQQNKLSGTFIFPSSISRLISPPQITIISFPPTISNLIEV